MLTAAAGVFDREGLTATTNRVAEAAGVSIGSLYQYFPNKQSLLVALAHRHTQTTTEAVDEIIAQVSNQSTVRELVQGLIGAVLRQHRNHPHLRTLMRTVSASTPEIQEQFDNCIAKAQQVIVAQLRHHHPDKKNPELRAQVMAAAVDGVIHNPTGYALDDAFEFELVELCALYLEHD